MSAAFTGPENPRRPPAIATTYKGTVFRSRTEARAAAFFDQVRWQWQYEPLDLAGYIPDFVLELPRRPLVEVKPDITFDGLAGHAKKIARSGWRGDFLVIGPMFLEAATNPGHLAIGVMGQWNEGPDGDGWADIDYAVLHVCLACKKPSFFHASGAWRCNTCGAADGNKYLGSPESAWFRHALGNAGNLTAWKGPAT